MDILKGTFAKETQIWEEVINKKAIILEKLAGRVTFQLNFKKIPILVYSMAQFMNEDAWDKFACMN